MTHHDSGWRPDLGLETYNGYEVWDHGIAPHEINLGEVDGTVEFDWEALAEAADLRPE